MSNSGRKRDIVWLSFIEIKSGSRKGLRAKCMYCSKEMEGQVMRMKKHMANCNKMKDINEDDEDNFSSSQSSASTTFYNKDLPTTSAQAATGVTASNSKGTHEGMSHMKKKKYTETLDSYLVKSTVDQKMALDEQVARYIYATNAPFRSVEHPEFVKLMEKLRPGYKPPIRKEISGRLLDSIYESEKNKCATILKNETVCIGFDGWSNIHNEPVVCVTVTTKGGESYLVETIDTSGTAHTGQNLSKIVISSIKKCEKDLQCIIRSLVTDNASNVTKMRDLLSENEELNLITYGCSAHILNLLANDFDYPRVTEQLLKIIKYFRNNHYANACYRSQTNTVKLVLPSDTRWNSMSDALQIYIKSWPVLLKICEENRDNIDKNIQALVSNLALKRNAEDISEQLKPIAVALDRMQKANCSIADAVYIWKILSETFKEKQVGKEVTQHLEARYKMALTPAHFLAYMLDPKEKKESLELSEQEKTEALKFANQKYPENSLLLLIMKFKAKSSPFQECFFEDNITSQITSYEWWESQKDEIDKFNNSVFGEIKQLLTAKASTACVERMFSSFGLVQSKLRNRLGLEKAAKLVFLFKMFN